MKLFRKKLIPLALVGVSASVHAHELRGGTMAALVGESAAVTDEVTGQPNRPFAPGNSGEQRRCQQGCRGKPKSPIKIRGCENKCLELGDEDARSIADFLQNEDAELIANFIQDIFDVKDSEESFDVEDSEDSFVEVMHRYCDRDVIFRNSHSSTRSDLERSARNGRLKKDHRDVWRNTKRARNKCKKAVGPRACRNMGYCGEDEFDDDVKDSEESFDVEDSEDSFVEVMQHACDRDVIFRNSHSSTRADLERSARNGRLGKDHRDVWKNTKQARNRCKKAVGPRQCKRMGYCGEDEFDDESGDVFEGES